jgi:exodeoxyribonuclease V alpha subunit
VVRGYTDFLARDATPEVRLRAFEHFRVLVAHRRGPFGVETVNRQIEEALAAAGFIRARAAFYHGRPVLVTQNDYQLGLFNGDIGVLLDGDAAGRGAYFIGTGGRLRRLSPSRLPPHETAFALTVHRSQGSEFDEVAVLLPDRPSPVVTRELLYTAVTRARHRVTIHATPEIVAHAIATRTERASGLRDALWGDQR